DSVKTLNDPTCGRRIEQMRLARVQLELSAMARLTVIERALTSTHDGVCAGLQVQICLCSHWFYDIHDCRKTGGRVAGIGKLCQLNVFRSDPQQNRFPKKLARP